MQVDTNVSETDVGNAKVGQKASFTVEAYPGRTFWGTVAQVREAPITVQNVVTYDVVVSVDNPDFALLPGMTANTRIVTDERDDVVRVPLKALRFSPRGWSTRTRTPRERSAASAAERPAGRHKADPARACGCCGVTRPERVPVVTGLTDGTFAEVSQGELQPGDRVIVDQVTHEQAEARPNPQGAGTRPRFRGF